jgi:hypothetical protein
MFNLTITVFGSVVLDMSKRTHSHPQVTKTTGIFHRSSIDVNCR